MTVRLFQRRPTVRRTAEQWRARRRVAELRRIYAFQFPDGLPANEMGVKYARYICRSMAFDPIDRREEWLDDNVPWLTGAERSKILKMGPHWYGARSLGNCIELTDLDREELKVRSIEAFDVSPKQRKAINREKDRKRDERRRRESGATTREQYLAANSLSRTKPWESMGMSRRTWYRAGKPMPDQSFECRNAVAVSEATRGDSLPAPNVIHFKHRKAA